MTLITKNEEANIGRCLESVKWADEIVILDSCSQDKTKEICLQYNNLRFQETEWLGFGLTKQKAVDLASNDWILSIDADEELSTALQKRIIKILENPQYQGYHIKRSSFYLGQMIKHCGWQSDYPLRLFNKQFGGFNSKIVHESVKVIGNTGTLNEVILHYTFPTISSHLEKMVSYSRLGAKAKFEKGKSTSIPEALIVSWTKFIKMYMLKKGFLDGKNGFILSLISSYGVLLKYLFLWEMHRRQR